MLRICPQPGLLPSIQRFSRHNSSEFSFTWKHYILHTYFTVTLKDMGWILGGLSSDESQNIDVLFNFCFLFVALLFRETTELRPDGRESSSLNVNRQKDEGRAGKGHRTMSYILVLWKWIAEMNPPLLRQGWGGPITNWTSQVLCAFFQMFPHPVSISQLNIKKKKRLPWNEELSWAMMLSASLEFITQ